MELEPKVSENLKIFTLTSNTSAMSKKMVKKKKVRGPESQLYTSVCPVVYAIRIFGLAPYEFHNDTLVPSSINSIYSYVCLVIYTYIIYTVMLRFTNIAMDKPLLDHTETGKAICNYFMAIFDIITTLYCRRKFVKIWNTIQDYDEIARNLGYARNETKTCILSWVILCAGLVTWITVNQFGMAAFDEVWINNVAYMIIYVGSSMSIIKFSGLTLLLGQRFEHLNEMARKSGPSVSRWLLASPVVDTRDIENLHNMLMLASEYLNSLCSWPLLLWLGNLCLHIVSDFYYLIQRMMSTSWTLTQWRILSCLITWISAFLAQLIFISYACDFTTSEANCMGFIMINWKRWLKNTRCNRGRYEDMETSIYLMNRRLDFSAAGCFCVNLPLLRSIAALLATYLVILLQFPE